MKALFICRNLMHDIKTKKIRQGIVHSIFSNACNIETESGLITLLSKDKAMAPMSIVIDNGRNFDFRKFNLKHKSDLYFYDNGICIEEQRININPEEVQIWSPEPKLMKSCITEAELIGNVKVLETGLNIYGETYGINPLMNALKEEGPEFGIPVLNTGSAEKSTGFIKHRFIDFIKAAAKLNIEEAALKAAGIIGYGEGLTPAVDDFIAGLMLSYIYLGYYYNLDISQIYRFNRALISKSLKKTTRVSSEMLKHAAEGRTNQVFREVFQTVIYQRDEERIVNALIKAVKIGASSGSDIIHGICTACKIITNSKYRGEWSNGLLCTCKERQLL